MISLHLARDRVLDLRELADSSAISLRMAFLSDEPGERQRKVDRAVTFLRKIRDDAAKLERQLTESVAQAAE